MSGIEARPDARQEVPPLDLPYTLALVFWSAMVEVVLVRGLTVVLSAYVPRGGTATIAAVLVGTGTFAHYFSTILGLGLGVHAIASLLARPGLLAWPRRVSVGFLGLTAVLSIAILLLQPVLPRLAGPERILETILTAVAGTTGVSFLLALQVITMRASVTKKIFATVPVLALVLAGVHQFFYFYPLAEPAWMPPGTPHAFLVAAQAIALAFPFPLAVHVAMQHMKSGLPVFIHVLVAISGFFPCLMLANLPGPMYGEIFLALLGMKTVLPAPGILYPLGVLPILFVFSALVGTPVTGSAFMTSRRRAGFALALIYVGTFTPLGATQIAMLLLGMVLWMKSIAVE